MSLSDVRRIWPDVLDTVKTMRRFTWILLSQNAQVVGLEGNVLTLGFKNAGAKDSFLSGGSDEILRQAAIDAIGADWKVEAIVDPSAEPGKETAPRVTRPAVDSGPARTQAPPPPAADPGPATESGGPPPDWAQEPPADSASDAGAGIAAARAGISRTRSADQPRPEAPDLDGDVSPDDPDADDNGLDSTELLARELGAVVIDEITHE